MSCGCSILTGGIAKACGTNSGGIRKIYITDLCNVSSLTLSSPDEIIDNINMLSGTQFYEFAFNKNTSSFTEVTTGDQAAGTQVVTQTVTLVLAKREKSKRDVLKMLMGFKELAVIVLDSNGTYWLLGEVEGMVMTENNSQSGTTKTDANGYTITLVAEETEQANEVDEAAVLAVI